MHFWTETLSLLNGPSGTLRGLFGLATCSEMGPGGRWFGAGMLQLL